MASGGGLSLDEAIREVLALFPGSTVVVDGRIVEDGRSGTDRPHWLNRRYARRRGHGKVECSSLWRG